MTLSVAESYREACVTSFQESLPIGSAHRPIGCLTRLPVRKLYKQRLGTT